MAKSKNAEVQSVTDVSKCNAFAEIAKAFLGQKVAILAARYQYRGRLSLVTSDSLVLANATAIESSGASNSAAPTTEDAIGGSVVIKFDAVEILYQPTWVNAPLPGES